MIRIQQKQMIDVGDWDELVQKTYGRPYSFQQQDGCKERGTFELTIPLETVDFENETVPDKVNGPKMGVKFSAWLARNPKEWKGSPRSDLEIFWERNFYPDVQMVANDLHSRGLIPAGDYVIDIDW